MSFLSGDQVELVPLDHENEAHVEAFRRSRATPSMRATGYYGGTMTTAQARDRVQTMQDVDDPNALCAIVADDDTAGWTGVRMVDLRARRVSLGYYVLPEFQGNGYASEAAALLVGYAFDELNANAVQAEVQGDNPASARVLEKLGFQHEGTRRQHYFKDGAYVDVDEYGLLRDEHRA